MGCHKVQGFRKRNSSSSLTGLSRPRRQEPFFGEASHPNPSSLDLFCSSIFPGRPSKEIPNVAKTNKNQSNQTQHVLIYMFWSSKAVFWLEFSLYQLWALFYSTNLLIPPAASYRLACLKREAFKLNMQSSPNCCTSFPSRLLEPR